MASPIEGVTEEEWNEVIDWIAGSGEEQRERILGTVMMRHKIKSTKRPHIKRIVETVFFELLEIQKLKASKVFSDD